MSDSIVSTEAAENCPSLSPFPIVSNRITQAPRAASNLAKETYTRWANSFSSANG
jgi:hypothetical protein